MGVIKNRFSISDRVKAKKRLFESAKDEFIRGGFTEMETDRIIEKIIWRTSKEMGHKYVNMGGYPAVQQLFDLAQKKLYELDEQGALDSLLSEEEEEIIQVAEPDLENAINAIESIEFLGSRKQIEWAENIAMKSREAIARAWKKKDFTLPNSAKWWIENREDIFSALVKL